MSEANVETVRAVFRLAAGFGGGADRDELERYLSDEVLEQYFDPGVQWVPASQSLLAHGDYRGYEGVRRFWTDFLSAWDEFHTEPVEIVDGGDNVAVVMRMRARKDELQIDEVWSSLSTLRDGKVVRVEGFTNRDGALKAAGLAE